MAYISEEREIDTGKPVDFSFKNLKKLQGTVKRKNKNRNRNVFYNSENIFISLKICMYKYKF